MRALLSLFLIALTLSSCTNRNGAVSFGPGDTAPDFALPLINGGNKKLSDYRGKVVLLNFWASWCGPCISELPSLERLQAKLAPRGLAVVSIGIDDDAESLEQFRSKFGLSFPVFLDNMGAIKGRYRLTGVPESFILDRDGKFIMVMDPESGEPVVRIIGPREWDTPNSITRISAVLG